MSRSPAFDAPHVMLVAKPWRGGLARYLRDGIADATGRTVDWAATHPGDDRVSRRAYANDRTTWRHQLTERVANAPHDAIVFLNPLAEFKALSPDPRYVAWLTDDPRPQIPNLGPYPRVFISDPGYASEMRDALGPRFAGVLPFACCARTHQPVQKVGEGVCMVANKDPKRHLHLRTLFAAGQPVAVYGNYFLRHPLFWRHPYWFRNQVPNAALGQVYTRFAVSLNVHAAVVSEGTNMRTFECAAFGIAQVVESRTGLADLFDPVEDLWTYADAGDAAAVIREALSDRDGQRRRAASAQERVLSQHTYQHRARTLLGH